MRGLIGLLITIGIIVLLFFGFGRMKNSPVNQIESGQKAIDQAKDAQAQQSQYDQILQNEVQDPPPVNYHGIQDNLRNIKQ